MTFSLVINFCLQYQNNVDSMYPEYYIMKMFFFFWDLPPKNQSNHGEKSIRGKQYIGAHIATLGPLIIRIEEI